MGALKTVLFMEVIEARMAISYLAESVINLNCHGSTRYGTVVGVKTGIEIINKEEKVYRPGKACKLRLSTVGVLQGMPYSLRLQLGIYYGSIGLAGPVGPGTISLGARPLILPPYSPYVQK